MDETPIATILRYLRQIAGFRLLARNFPMFLSNVIGGYKDHEPINISLCISDAMFDKLKYRNSYSALKLGNKVIGFIDESNIGAERPVAPTNAPIEIQCTVIEHLMIPV